MRVKRLHQHRQKPCATTFLVLIVGGKGNLFAVSFAIKEIILNFVDPLICIHSHQQKIIKYG